MRSKDPGSGRGLLLPGKGAATLEHVAELSKTEVARLALWLTYPHGSLGLGRVTFEPVVSGGVLVRHAV